MNKPVRTDPSQLPKEGHVTPSDNHLPKSARTKQRTTLVTKNTGTKKIVPKKKG